MLDDYAYVLVFLVVGVVFAFIFTNLPYLVTRRSRGVKASDTYESGEDTIGSAWVQFDVIYYLFALIFIAFDVEVIYLFPVLVSYGMAPTLAALLKITLFLGILVLALVYAWRKGLFSWK